MSSTDIPPAAEPIHPARDYIFFGLISLVVVFVGFTIRGSMVPAAALLIIGGLGMLARITWMPILFLIAVVYLSMFPFGIPVGWNPETQSFLNQREDPGKTYFRITDLILVSALVAYVVCHYRLMGLTSHIMPSDTIGVESQAICRPREAVTADEFNPMLAIVGGSVFVGQLLWLMLTVLAVDFRNIPPLTLATNADTTNPFVPPLSFARLLLFAVALVGGGFLTRFVFWYWRLSQLNPGEARMMILDTQWRESRRELNRQEKWRAWGRPGGRYVVRHRPQPPQSKLRQTITAAVLFVLMVILLRVYAAWLG